jgi:hypothetical protein
MADDGYVAWYQAKLWQLLPAIYRTSDPVDLPDGPGPLREFVNRIGAQVAVIRRSIDRLWENQSIETCDDWVIPYIGDLLATRLVSCLPPPAQRRDVANTIYYRRRSGTLGLLEELAADIAGRDARAVEFFRRLARTRHQFDPPIGNVPVYDPTMPPSSAVIEGLAGAYSRTPAGGFADLRKPYATANSANAFDEYAHTADVRRGAQSSGWHNISHLGIFIWWLYSFPIEGATPVGSGEPACFTFDPSGREIQLFAKQRTASSFGAGWVSPDQWDLPVPVRSILWQNFPAQLYGSAFSVEVCEGVGVAPVTLPPGAVSVHPERGLFSFTGTPPEGIVVTKYQFGFMSPIGAGGFDEGILEPVTQPPVTATVSGGGGALATALTRLTHAATIEVDDSLTYREPAGTTTLPPGELVVLCARNRRRPVIRRAGAAPHAWTITGTGASLILQGIWLQGADLVLTGSFDKVTLRLATLDPGTAGTGNEFFARAIDGTPLRPVTVWVEANIDSFEIERCITGPIRTRNGGSIEQLTATDSIIQSIPTHAVASGAPIFDPADLAAKWKSATDRVSVQIRAGLPHATLEALAAYAVGAAPDAALIGDLAAALGTLDRAKMEAAYPLALADLALGTSSGTVSLTRCTVLGRSYTHRLDASDCIFDDIAVVEDTQHGCIRFSAYAQGSVLHAPYRSVMVPARGPLFRSRDFGNPEYARLLRLADTAIINPAPGDSILAGADNASEMGAFSSEGIPLIQRGLAQKFEEYTPLGIYPVWIDAD